MKKIISVCLAVALAASMLCMNIFAAETTPPDTLTNIVGTYKGKDAADASVADGITASEFGNTNASTDIDITFNQGIEHRYAVDIVFSGVSANFGASLVWDVNTHTYVPAEADTKDKQAVTITPSIKITNHSDMPVYYKTVVAVANPSAAGLTVAVPAEARTGHVDAVTVGSADGTTATVSANVTVTPSNPNKSWAEYIRDNNRDLAEIKVATYTVTISKDSI